MPKRSVEDSILEEAILAANINDADWIQKLVEVEREQLILIVSLLANKANIGSNSIKKARTELPSFSTVKWADFAARAGLPKNPSILGLEPFVTPVYQLPPSFHKAVFVNSWHTQDVYLEAVQQTREESRVRILDPYIVPILALFHGRVIDKPEDAMLANEFATGGEVEHEVIMIGGILFFVIEMKHDRITDNNLAQLFLGFLSAAKVNKEADFEGLRIYGILTNMTWFGFYSYNPTTNSFCQDEDIIINVRRDDFSLDMIYITNKIFGIVLFAFIEGLRAIVERSKQRVVKGDFTVVGSSVLKTLPSSDPHFKPDELEQSAQGKRARKSTEGWELALRMAEECRQKLSENVTTIEDMEIKSTEALELLTKSVRSIPRYGLYTTNQDSTCLTPAELKNLACQIVENKLRASLP